VATRNSAPESEQASTGGFSEEQRSELRSLIAEVVGGDKPPPAPAAPSRVKVSDSDWDGASDRQRESWVRQMVDDELERLAKDDEIARQRADIDALKADKTPEPEKAPNVVTKLQKFLWGDPEDK